MAYPRVACEMDVRDRRIASAPTSSRSVAECVSGVLTRNDAVLVEKRRADDEADPGLTFLPGGHVEPGESSAPTSSDKFLNNIPTSVH